MSLLFVFYFKTISFLLNYCKIACPKISLLERTKKLLYIAKNYSKKEETGESQGGWT